ncbi:olfactory receptor 6C76-like [Canis lupus dingo]|uniref:olfactory receptor 6C76-like n=1 Tax=Canis lupus dingo TaxID=286419 RepID=UPI000DC66958|nr:olfactory receptor 6C76-like [Canis lupus dingo]
MANQTIVTEFFLQGLTDTKELQEAVFLLLLLAFLVTISGNLLDFFHVFLEATEFLLLTPKACDHYIAICQPLCYLSVMSNRVCTRLILTCWLAGFSFIIVPVILTSHLPLCNTHINHFFCNYMPLMEVVCSRPQVLEVVAFTLAIEALVSTVLLITISYVQIIQTIVRIPSVQERRKAFSTSSSHIIVITRCYDSCFFMYVKPSLGKGVDFNKGVSVINTIIAPLLNPFIYTLRNQQVKEVVKNLIRKMAWIQNK